MGNANTVESVIAEHIISRSNINTSNSELEFPFKNNHLQNMKFELGTRKWNNRTYELYIHPQKLELEYPYEICNQMNFGS